jgi:hypothetical protein
MRRETGGICQFFTQAVALMACAGQARFSTMQSMKKTYLIAGAVVLALAGGGAWWWTQRDAAADVQYRTGKIERGSTCWPRSRPAAR